MYLTSSQALCEYYDKDIIIKVNFISATAAQKPFFLDRIRVIAHLFGPTLYVLNQKFVTC